MSGAPEEDQPKPGKVETWGIEHPELGRIQVHVGSAEQLRAMDPGFPAAKEPDEAEEAEGTESEGADRITQAAELVEAKEAEGKSARLLKALIAVGTGVPAMLVTREGAVVARYERLDERKAPLDMEAAEKLEADSYTIAITSPSHPRLVVDTGRGDRWVKSIYVQDAHGGTVDIIPPEGSRAQEYYRAMEESPWKRLVYPLLGGMSKAGWAVGVLVLGPLVSRLISWLVSLLPDFSIDVPRPDISLPSISWPSISLPSIPWPDIPWPDISFPSVTVPDWIKVVVEHEKIWFPLLLGLVVGVISLRRARTARRTRQRWRSGEAETPAESPGTGATEPEGKPEEK
ncbi:hypothetical protein [Corynebacterium oculi]|uniref:Uncharacterized protein n=1 Tax=Corynebacterium oculi TaxID=1544416 RepID=A0A0Q0UEG6_9CORY|nr:hypothetical protein [Corynebacterium oculi]KQB85051.1 hypothetical protein Cocul_00186 [Corynebacterium oculi]